MQCSIALMMRITSLQRRRSRSRNITFSPMTKATITWISISIKGHDPQASPSSILKLHCKMGKNVCQKVGKGKIVSGTQITINWPCFMIRKSDDRCLACLKCIGQKYQ